MRVKGPELIDKSVSWLLLSIFTHILGQIIKIHKFLQINYWLPPAVVSPESGDLLSQSIIKTRHQRISGEFLSSNKWVNFPKGLRPLLQSWEHFIDLPKKIELWSLYVELNSWFYSSHILCKDDTSYIFEYKSIKSS